MSPQVASVVTWLLYGAPFIAIAAFVLWLLRDPKQATIQAYTTNQGKTWQRGYYRWVSVAGNQWEGGFASIEEAVQNAVDHGYTVVSRPDVEDL